MLSNVATVLAGLIDAGIIFTGAYAFRSPQAAAGFGVPGTPTAFSTPDTSPPAPGDPYGYAPASRTPATPAGPAPTVLLPGSPRPTASQ
ncbi:hypothetical protein OH799_05600 [Nocardia sp. NBC_00881]|nr:hypothetical protein OH799_05600 [Nocardia sp. NBC_00881]